MANSFKLLDLFSGIGGFHLGLEQAGFKFDWTGFSEIDKYANKQYKKRFPNARELGDVTAIQCEDLPKDIDILCGGFPCQTFSIAGKRKGFDDTRGTLFFEIARILRYFRGTEQPIPYFILENVKGLLNHEDGQTFATIYGILTELGYTVECQIVNTRWFLPQNRERIYIVGYIGNRGGPQVFPIGEPGKISDNRNAKVANTLQHPGHSGGNCKGMTMVQVPEATKKGYAEAGEGDSINFSVPNSKTRRGRVGKGEAQTLDTGMQQYTIQPKILDDYNNKIKDDGVTPTVTQHCSRSARRNGIKVINNTSIRRLTPVECNRLQGFNDNHNKYGEIDGKVVEMSDTQRYKQAGNAVTVDVVQAVAERIRPLFEDNKRV